MRTWVPFLIVGLLAGAATAAQERERTAVERERTPVERTADEVRERVRRAIRLPTTTDVARDAGVDEERIREVLRSGRERRVPAGEMEEILEIENEAIRESRDKDNFGAAVLAMKESGLRGRELAESIHAEQVARGMKKPKERGGGPDGAKGKAKGQAKGKSKGKAKERP